MKNKKTIIGLVGPKGVGKNFVANILAGVLSRQSSSTQLAFADELKDFCEKVLGLRREQCRGTDADKNTLTEYRWEKMPPAILEQNSGKSGFMTAREVMQVFGTDIMRNFFSPKIWIDSLGRKIQRLKTDFAIITDVRFQNEGYAIETWGGILWRINGPQRGEAAALGDKHSSETELQKIEVHSTINNTMETTEEDVQERVCDLLMGFPSPIGLGKD